MWAGKLVQQKIWKVHFYLNKTLETQPPPQMKFPIHSLAIFIMIEHIVTHQPSGGLKVLCHLEKCKMKALKHDLQSPDFPDGLNEPGHQTFGGEIWWNLSDYSLAGWLQGVILKHQLLSPLNPLYR